MTLGFKAYLYCNYQHTKVKRNNPLTFIPSHCISNHPTSYMSYFIDTGFQILGIETYTEVNYFGCGCGFCLCKLKDQIFLKHLYLVNFSRTVLCVKENWTKSIFPIVIQVPTRLLRSVRFK